MKKVIARTWLYISAFCCMALFCACSGGDDGEDGPVVNTDILNVESANITIGGNELTATIKITANCHWVIQKQTGTDGDWLTVSPTEGRADATVTLTANSANPSSVDNRKMTLVIKTDGGISRSIIVTQTTASETLSVSPESLTFDYHAGMKEFHITSNANWSIAGKQDWFTLSAYAGKGSQTIQVNVQENPSETSARIPATLVITTENSKLRKDVTINQEAHQTTLNVSTTSITASAPTASYTIQLTGEASWTASSNQSWAKLEQTSGKGDATLTVKCEDNTSLYERTAIISIESASNKYNVSVTQAAATWPEITDVKATDTNKEGATFTFNYTSMYPVTEYGICYSSTNHMPDKVTDAYKSQTGSAQQGTASIQLTGLKAGTTYYIRAYAISSVGIQYSNSISFITNDDWPGGDDNVTPGL